MATYVIVEEAPVYYTLDVEFDGLSFRQLLISEQIGQGLADQLQAYADAYQSDYESAQ